MYEHVHECLQPWAAHMQKWMADSRDFGSTASISSLQPVHSIRAVERHAQFEHSQAVLDWRIPGGFDTKKKLEYLPGLPLGTEISMFDLKCVDPLLHISPPSYQVLGNALCLSTGSRSTWSASVGLDITKTGLDPLHEHPHAIAAYLHGWLCLVHPGTAFLLLPW
jgi:hypothetical protein